MVKLGISFAGLLERSDFLPYLDSSDTVENSFCHRASMEIRTLFRQYLHSPKQAYLLLDFSPANFRRLPL